MVEVGDAEENVFEEPLGCALDSKVKDVIRAAVCPLNECRLVGV